MDVIALGTQHPAAERATAEGLAGELKRLPTRIGPSQWAGWEHAYGYAVYALPFSSGHVLALRAFPQNDFAPFMTVWHRTPDGVWSIFYDGPRPDIGCPRYFGAAAERVQRARIALTWTGPMTARVEMNAPALDWTVSMRTTPLLRAMNAVSSHLPAWTWRSRALAHGRAWLARWMLGMGKVTLSGTMPSGHIGALTPVQVFFITEACALLDGQDLGEPIRAKENPSIGQVRLSARPTFVVGRGFWRTRDQDEYRRTAEELRESATV